MVTVDSFFEGKHKEPDWHNIDRQFYNFAIEQKYQLFDISTVEAKLMKI